MTEASALKGMINKRSVARVTATLVILAIGCGGAYALWRHYMTSPWTRDARIQADVVTIAPDVAGFVNDLRVKDNQLVRKGDILFIVDQERYKLNLASAAANAAAREAEMNMQKGIAARRAKMTHQEISTEEKETARHTASSASASHQQALADQSLAQLDLERTVVRAPVNGFVTNLTLVVGQYAAVGTEVMAIIDSDSYRVVGYFEETKIPFIRPNDRAEIRLMSGGALRGHVDSISRGITDRDNPSGPQLLADVNPTFEWVRLAQRIPVRIQIDVIPPDVHISSGMTCTVVLTASEEK